MSAAPQLQLSQHLEFEKEAQNFIQWCKDEALPFWAEKGVDPKGGFFETLSYDGGPDLSVKRRVRVQARQSYVYSLATIKSWYKPSQWVANHGWRFLTQQGFAGGEHIASHGFKGCAHLLNVDGTLHDGMRDTYAQAFLLLASAWRYRATLDPQALETLYAATLFLRVHFKSDFGGWVEDCGHSLPRRQNPHMHLFEAFLAAYEATKDGLFLGLADEVFDLFKSHFFDVQHHCVLEYFSEDWTPMNKASARVEPGHIMEWCWLLEWYGRLSGRTIGQYVDSLFNSAVKHGLNPNTAFLINEYRLDGTISNGSSRLWPQTEYLKACIARYRLGNEQALSEAANVIKGLMESYLNTPLEGGWHDKLDSKGRVVSTHMPASTFYHIACAANEVDNLIQQLISETNCG